jgi:hypothetical protein
MSFAWLQEPVSSTVLLMIGPGNFEPAAMLVFGKTEGPGKSVPVRGLGIGLFLVQ